MTINEYINIIKYIMGKTIVIVYNYPGDSDVGAKKYDFWEGDVIADWIHAIYELHGLPLLFDARTFVEKIMNKTMPPIDFVVNLSDGYSELSSLSLVPSACSYNGIPCIPCNASTLLLGENKAYSNDIANTLGFILPKQYKKQNNNTISRPYCFGGSCGIIKGIASNDSTGMITQEFIPGIDITIPSLYCPLTESLQVLPAIAYKPIENDPNWFLGEQQKKTHSEYKKTIISVDEKTKQMVKLISSYIGVNTYCRIDFRGKCSSGEDMINKLNTGISWEELRFIEINTLPTIKENVNFITSLSHLDQDSIVLKCFEIYKEHVREATNTGFVLSCSIMSLITTKH